MAGIFGAMAVSFLNLFYYIQVATGDATPKWLYWVLALISPTGFALGMDKVCVNCRTSEIRHLFVALSFYL